MDHYPAPFHPEEFIEGYLALWNRDLCDLSVADIERYVHPSCINRFGQQGAEGMFQTIQNRRRAFPDSLRMSMVNWTCLPEEDGFRVIKIEMFFEDIYEGTVEVLHGVNINIRSEVLYKISDDGRIIGGFSNLREMILGALKEDYIEEDLERLTRGEF